MSRRPRRRARLSLPFALLAVAIVGVIFTSAAMSNAQQDAERNTGASGSHRARGNAYAVPFAGGGHADTDTNADTGRPRPRRTYRTKRTLKCWRGCFGRGAGRSFGYGKSGGCVVRSEPR